MSKIENKNDLAPAAANLSASREFSLTLDASFLDGECDAIQSKIKTIKQQLEVLDHRLDMAMQYKLGEAAIKEIADKKSPLLKELTSLSEQLNNCGGGGPKSPVFEPVPVAIPPNTRKIPFPAYVREMPRVSNPATAWASAYSSLNELNGVTPEMVTAEQQQNIRFSLNLLGAAPFLPAVAEALPAILGAATATAPLWAPQLANAAEVSPASYSYKWVDGENGTKLVKLGDTVLTVTEDKMDLVSADISSNASSISRGLNVFTLSDGSLAVIEPNKEKFGQNRYFVQDGKTYTVLYVSTDASGNLDQSATPLSKKTEDAIQIK